MKDVGWEPAREVARVVIDQWATTLAQTDGFVLFSAARRILSEFGGLRYVAPGRKGVDFSPLSFCLDPMLAIGESDRICGYQKSLGSALFPIGEAENGHAFIVADERGRIYLVMDRCIILGEDVHAAIVNMIEGRARGV